MMLTQIHDQNIELDVEVENLDDEQIQVRVHYPGLNLNMTLDRDMAELLVEALQKALREQ